MSAWLTCFVSGVHRKSCMTRVTLFPDMTVAPTPEGRRHCCRSGNELRYLLAENAEVSAPELVVLNRADRAAEAVREAGQVLGEQLRPRLVGRVAVLRVGQHERVREVRVRAVDQRHV